MSAENVSLDDFAPQDTFTLDTYFKAVTNVTDEMIAYLTTIRAEGKTNIELMQKLTSTAARFCPLRTARRARTAPRQRGSSNACE